MPSSISSSSERLPLGPWGKTWAIAVVTAAAVLLCYEGLWRSRGYVPEIANDATLWCQARRTVRAGDRNVIVLIGASRMQLGMNSQVLSECLGGRRVVQLALNASSCLPVLQHLSRDDGFCGVVICGVLPGQFYSGIRLNDGDQVGCVRQYEQGTASAGVEAMLRQWVHSFMVGMRPELSPAEIGVDGRIWERRWSNRAVTYTRLLPDRNELADYSKLSDMKLSEVRLFREERVRQGCSGTSAEQWERDLMLVNEMVGRINHRGGCVVFVTMPTSGGVRQIEEERFPRKRYWDVLVSRTKSLSIHFADYPALQYECPEGSHMDYRDAAKFTRSFAAILSEKLRSR